MKTLIATLAAVAAVTTVAGPAAAQPFAPERDRYERQDEWRSVNQRQADLERRIERGLQRGDLTRREAFRLRAEFLEIARLEASYRRGGLSRWERADLDNRFDRLQAQIRSERRDRDYGYNSWR